MAQCSKQSGSVSHVSRQPILHAIELARDAAYSSYGADGVSMSYLAGCTMVTGFLALAYYFGFWKQAISR